MKVLLVEDDDMVGEALTEGLSDQAFVVEWIKQGKHVPQHLLLEHYDVLVLDLNLGDADGQLILQRLRADGVSVPVIIVSARDTLEDRLSSLNFGADDYLVKPFELSELIARIYAVVRRVTGVSRNILSNLEISIHLDSHEVTLKSGEVVLLSKKEFTLLEALLLNPGRILSRRVLEDKIYNFDDDVSENALEFLIHSLRKKIGSNVIKNIRGVGWMVSKS